MAAGGELEIVVVTSTHSSLAKSLEAKRESRTAVDVVAAEDVGNFPDKDVAEALQPVSCVSISREFSGRERVSMRVTTPHLHRILLNGHAIATLDRFVLDKRRAACATRVT